jgi:hypothetical protein
MKIYMKGRILVEFDLWSCMSCFWLYTCTLVSGRRIWLLVNSRYRCSSCNRKILEDKYKLLVTLLLLSCSVPHICLFMLSLVVFILNFFLIHH